MRSASRPAAPLDPEVATGMLNATRHAGTLTALTREHDAPMAEGQGRCSGAIADQLVVTQAAAG
jgi:hypothetical protein